MEILSYNVSSVLRFTKVPFANNHLSTAMKFSSCFTQQFFLFRGIKSLIYILLTHDAIITSVADKAVMTFANATSISAAAPRHSSADNLAIEIH